MNTSTNLFEFEERQFGNVKNFLSNIANSFKSSTVTTVNNSRHELSIDRLLNSSRKIKDNNYSNEISSYITGKDILFPEFLKKCESNVTSVHYLESSFTISQSNNPINIAIGRIRTLSMYEAGWNGENSIGADEQTVSEAEELIRIIFKYNVQKPIISLANDGEINFYWNFDRNVLDLGVFGDGCYSYYFRSKDGREIFADDRPVRSIINDEILNIIIV